MTFFASAALINAISSGILGYVVFTHNKKGAVNRAFFYYSIAITFWSGAYFLWQISKTDISAIFWCKALMMGAIMIPVLYTRFVYRLINKPEHKILMYLFFAVSIVFLFLNLGNFLVDGMMARSGFDLWPTAGPAFIYYLIVWFSIVVYSVYLLFIEYFRATNHKKTQLFYVLIGTIIGYLGGATNYPLWLDIKILPWGNILITFYTMVMAYSILKYKLLDIKIIYTEAIIIFVFFALLVDALISPNYKIALLRMVIVLLFSVVGQGLIKNIGELKKANRQLEHDKKELVELDRMKDEFLQMATHELNTPITAIQGKLDMAVTEDLCKLNPEQKAFLKPILNETTRLGHLSRDVLNTARIDQHRMAINRSETDLDALISDIVKNLEVKAKEKGDSIAYIPMSKSLPKIGIDQSKIGEVITNLVGNAIKFTEKGKIAVTSKIKEGDIVVSVSDTGVGIDKEGQKHLFEKFYQAGRFDPENPQEQQGTGLGLYISQNIIGLHGGKMWLESVKDKGSIFYFSLPLEYKEDKAKNGAIAHKPLEVELTSVKAPLNTETAETKDVAVAKSATADTSQASKSPVDNPTEKTIKTS